jgi:hypothetical protein
MPIISARASASRVLSARRARRSPPPPTRPMPVRTAHEAGQSCHWRSARKLRLLAHAHPEGGREEDSPQRPQRARRGRWSREKEEQPRKAVKGTGVRMLVSVSLSAFSAWIPLGFPACGLCALCCESSSGNLGRLGGDGDRRGVSDSRRAVSSAIAGHLRDAVIPATIANVDDDRAESFDRREATGGRPPMIARFPDRIPVRIDPLRC